MRPKISKLFCYKRPKKLPNASYKLPLTTTISFIIVRERECMYVCVYDKQKTHHSFLDFFLLFSRHFNFVMSSRVVVVVTAADVVVKMSWKQKKAQNLTEKNIFYACQINFADQNFVKS